MFIAKSICETRVRGQDARLLVLRPVWRGGLPFTRDETHDPRALWSSSSPPPLVTRRGEAGASWAAGRERRSFGFVRVPSRVRRAGSLRNGLVRDNAEDPVRNQFRETAAAGLDPEEGREGKEGGRGEGNGELSFRNLA